MAKTLVTGGSGFLGSHVVRALAARGDELRLLLRRGSSVDHLADLEFERAGGDVLDRASVGRRWRAWSASSTWPGTTSMRAQDRDRVFELNVRGTRIVLEEALAAEVGRVVHASSVAAIGPAKPGGTADEAQPFRAGGLGIAYVNSKHEAEVEALRLAARGLAVVIVNPSFVLGPDDPKGTSMALVRRFLLGRIPVYVDGGAQHRRRPRRRAGPPAGRREGGERRALHPRRPELHARPAVRRLRPDLRPRAGAGQGCRAPRPRSRSEAMARAGLPMPVSPDEVRSAMQWWTYRNTKARRELGFEPRPHEETLEDAVRWQMDELGDRVRTGRGPRGGGARRGRAAASPRRAGAGSVIVLYRCPTRTNVLCPCGAVARRLESLGLEYRTERVPYRRSRPPGDRGADAPEPRARCWSTATR